MISDSQYLIIYIRHKPHKWLKWKSVSSISCKASMPYSNLSRCFPERIPLRRKRLEKFIEDIFLNLNVKYYNTNGEARELIYEWRKERITRDNKV